MKPLILTPGDPDGIGPEITWKLLKTVTSRSSLSKTPILVIGAAEPLRKLGATLHEARLSPQGKLSPAPRTKKNQIWLLPAPTKVKRGIHLAGFQAGWSVETAARLCLNGEASALVTGPLHKERFQAGGFQFSGHTDFLAHLSGNVPVTMMLANDQLRVSLVTCHQSLSSVPASITAERITQTVEHTLCSLRELWGIRKPRIAIAALNPHAGEGGLLGYEESTVIEPCLKKLQKKWGSQAEILGPFPADTLFVKHLHAPKKNKFDAVVAMYHDQGLTPVKLLDFAHTVNLSLGLPLIRTSVDHGTAFDIAGKGIADPSSLKAATHLAIRFIKGKERL